MANRRRLRDSERADSPTCGGYQPPNRTRNFENNWIDTKHENLLGVRRHGGIARLVHNPVSEEQEARVGARDRRVGDDLPPDASARSCYGDGSIDPMMALFGNNRRGHEDQSRQTHPKYLTPGCLVRRRHLSSRRIGLRKLFTTQGGEHSFRRKHG